MTLDFIINRAALKAVALSLALMVVTPQISAESIKATGRAAPHSGIEQLQSYCTIRNDSEADKGIFNDLPQLVEMIESALDRNFQAKGFNKAVTGTCEIEMHYEVAIEEQQQIKERRYGPATPAQSVTDRKGKLRMGQLILDAYNKSQNRKIWTGQASNTEGVYINLTQPKDEDMNALRQRVNTAVDKMFKRFPARVK